MSIRTVDWIDGEGIKRRMLLPEEAEEVEEGVPISLDVDVLYMQATVTFRRNLIDELWARGLVVPADFVRPDSPELIRSALLATVRRDTLDIMSLAKERLDNGKRNR